MILDVGLLRIVKIGSLLIYKHRIVWVDEHLLMTYLKIDLQNSDITGVSARHYCGVANNKAGDSSLGVGYTGTHCSIGCFFTVFMEVKLFSLTWIPL